MAEAKGEESMAEVRAEDILDRAAVKVDIVTMHLEKQPGVFQKHLYKVNTFVRTDRILTFTVEVTKNDFPVKTIDCHSYFDWSQPSLDLCFKVSRLRDNKPTVMGHGAIPLLDLFDQALRETEDVPALGGRRCPENKVSLTRYVRLELVKMPTMQRPIVLELIVSLDSDLALLQAYRKLVQYKEIYKMLDPDFKDQDLDLDEKSEREQKDSGGIERVDSEMVVSSEILMGIDNLSHGDIAETLRKDKLSSLKVLIIIIIIRLICVFESTLMLIPFARFETFWFK